VLNVSNGVADLLVAGSGNESLNAFGANGAVTLRGGSGFDLVTLGSGAGLYVAGSGGASVNAGSGNNEFSFTNGISANVTISGFAIGRDTLSLLGYNSGAATPNFHTSKEKTEIFHRVMRPAEF